MVSIVRLMCMRADELAKDNVFAALFEEDPARLKHEEQVFSPVSTSPDVSRPPAGVAIYQGPYARSAATWLPQKHRRRRAASVDGARQLPAALRSGAPTGQVRCLLVLSLPLVAVSSGLTLPSQKACAPKHREHELPKLAEGAARVAGP
jgi:hypothetical protein